MTLAEVSALTKLSKRTLSAHMQKGDLKGFKVGSTYRFSVGDVNSWIEELKRTDPALIPHLAEGDDSW